MSDSSHPLAPAAAASAPPPEPATGFAADADEVAFDTAFDPAEYRWVPVRRKRRADGWTPERQRRFIEVLADTGIVRHAARAVNMTEQAAHALRRAPGAEGFAAAWRAALDHAADLLASVAFARAIEGEERTIYDRAGHAVGARIHYNDRLLQFLLRAHRPEQYARDTGRERNAAKRETPVRSAGACRPAALQARSDDPAGSTPVLAYPLTVAEALRAMEPQLPAPPEELADDIASDLQVADMADGVVPRIWRDWSEPQDFALSRAQEAALERAKQGGDARAGKGDDAFLA